MNPLIERITSCIAACQPMAPRHAYWIPMYWNDNARMKILSGGPDWHRPAASSIGIAGPRQSEVLGTTGPTSLIGASSEMTDRTRSGLRRVRVASAPNWSSHAPQLAERGSCASASIKRRKIGERLPNPPVFASWSPRAPYPDLRAR